MKVISTRTSGYWKFIKILCFEFRILKIKKMASDLVKLTNDLAEFRRNFDSFVDIKKAPVANGNLRKIQLLDSFLLKELKRICNKINVKFWLSDGTLLGAYRHNGFIPWDDDMDVSIMRSDFMKLYKYVNNNSDKYIIKFFYHYDCKVAKFTFKNINSPAFIDIFPFDYCENSKSMAKEWYSDKQELISAMGTLNFPDGTEEKLTNDQLALINNLNDRYKLKWLSMSNNKRTGICLAIEQLNPWDFPYMFPIDMIFPLSSIMFDGEEYYAPAKTEQYLENCYGDYMKFPSKIHTHNFLLADDEYNKSIEILFEKYKYLQ